MNNRKALIFQTSHGKGLPSLIFLITHWRNRIAPCNWCEGRILAEMHMTTNLYDHAQTPTTEHISLCTLESFIPRTQFRSFHDHVLDSTVTVDFQNP